MSTELALTSKEKHFLCRFYSRRGFQQRFVSR